MERIWVVIGYDEDYRGEVAAAFTSEVDAISYVTNCPRYVTHRIEETILFKLKCQSI